MRRGRTSQDISCNQSVLDTVQNRLTSLVRSLKIHLMERTTNHPTPLVIKEIGKCLDLDDILKKDETTEVKKEREKSIMKVMLRGKYDEDTKKEIVKEYDLFKQRVKEIMKPKGEMEEIVKRFQHHLFKVHSCHKGCVKVIKTNPGNGPGLRLKVCSEEGKVLQHLEPNLMKIIHVFYKEPCLYLGIKSFHLYL